MTIFTKKRPARKFLQPGKPCALKKGLGGGGTLKNFPVSSLKTKGTREKGTKNVQLFEGEKGGTDR